MNSLLDLSNNIAHSVSPQGGSPKLKGRVTSSKIRTLIEELENCRSYWKKITFINGCLIQATFKQIIPKSSRLKKIFQTKQNIEDCIRGIRYKPAGPGLFEHHFIYFISASELETSIAKLKNLAQLIDNEFNGEVSGERLTPNPPTLSRTANEHEKIAFEKKKKEYEESVKTLKKIDWKSYDTSRTEATQIVIDCSFCDAFQLPEPVEFNEKLNIYTIFKTGIKGNELLDLLGISADAENWLDETTVFLRPTQARKLMERFPYIVSMSLDDELELEKTPMELSSREVIKTPKPNFEPQIGVLDTGFDINSPFSPWIEYQNCIPNLLDERMTSDNKEDFAHGTCVSTIIASGPDFNPELDDGCGKFRVKHFAITSSLSMNVLTVCRLLRKIVPDNPSIKIWNLSLGSPQEINPNSMSYLGAVLDDLQHDYKVLFVVSGTNDDDLAHNKRLGLPADSAHSIVVNSVTRSGKATNYSRKGKALTFFNKPDLSYYGGDSTEPLYSYFDGHIVQIHGTSFAAPWVTRKAAYLYYRFNFPIEIVKALLLDAAGGWRPYSDDPLRKGIGILPVHIRDVLKIRNDEIRFYVYGEAQRGTIFSDSLPVPTTIDGAPFFARMVCCYFPDCDRTKGVDYTNVELDIRLGRIKEISDTSGATRIEAINKNRQRESALPDNKEASVRQLYEKWNNSKVVCEVLNERAKPRKPFEGRGWAFSITKIDRNHSGDYIKSIPFGLVVTLKEMEGKNRFNEFFNECRVQRLQVKAIDIDAVIDLTNKLDQTIELD